MKRLQSSLLVVAVAAMVTVAYAQPPGRPGGAGPGGRPGAGPGGPGGRGGQGGGRGFGGPGRGGPPPSPIVAALDADGDGEISAEEIENAVAALKKLDKDGDGKLSAEETRPPRPQFGRGARGGPDGAGPGGPGGGPRGGGEMVARIMELDKNNDGKITKDEVGEDRRAAFIVGRADTDGDGVVTKAEVEKLAEEFQNRGGGGRGGRGGAGRGGPGGPGGAGGRRPQRPPAE